MYSNILKSMLLVAPTMAIELADGVAVAWEIGAPSTFCHSEQKEAASAAFMKYVDRAAEEGDVGQCKVQGDIISANFPSTT